MSVCIRISSVWEREARGLVRERGLARERVYGDAANKTG